MVPWESSRSDSQLYRPKTGQDLLMQPPRCNWRAAQVRYGLERNSEPPEKFGAEAEPCLLYVDTAQGTELELLYFGCCMISALASSLNQLKSPFPRCATGGGDHDLAMTSKDSAGNGFSKSRTGQSSESLCSTYLRDFSTARKNSQV